jgi:hypothetical protein
MLSTGEGLMTLFARFVPNVKIGIGNNDCQNFPDGSNQTHKKFVKLTPAYNLRNLESLGLVAKQARFQS